MLGSDIDDMGSTKGKKVGKRHHDGNIMTKKLNLRDPGSFGILNLQIF